ncbi:hypothetical protein [Hoeflea sp. TYP-13]|uniref:hypothetical protein n=1 Tax=Hoeflea sp. TYP-13 TaxID=3230023 RepID=UPI0034C68108
MPNWEPIYGESIPGQVRAAEHGGFTLKVAAVNSLFCPAFWMVTTNQANLVVGCGYSNNLEGAKQATLDAVANYLVVISNRFILQGSGDTSHVVEKNEAIDLLRRGKVEPTIVKGNVALLPTKRFLN